MKQYNVREKFTAEAYSFERCKRFGPIPFTGKTWQCTCRIIPMLEMDAPALSRCRLTSDKNRLMFFFGTAGLRDGGYERPLTADVYISALNTKQSLQPYAVL
jgi:hypothetical protein